MAERQLKYYKIPDKLTGNCYNFGRTDSGKTWKMTAIAQAFHGIGYKIWDLFGGKRNENSFWALKSTEDKLWNEFEYEVGELSSPGPKEYKVNLLYPCFINKLPNKLPQESPRVKSNVFSIPFRKITIEDISLVIGDVSSNARYVWNTILNSTNKNSNGSDIQHLMNTDLKRYRDLSIYKLFIKPLIDYHLFCSENSEMSIDLISEAKDVDTISVLCHEYLPDTFKFFVMGYFLRQILYEFAMHDKISKKNISMLREASLFMKIQDKNIQGAETTQIFRNLVSDIARYCRSGLFLFIDTQSPFEVKGLIEGQDDLMILNEMPSARDRDEACDRLRKDRRMSSPQISYLSRIPVHQMVVVARKQNAKLIRRVMPPRNMCWKQGMGNFLTVWKKYKNMWINTNIFTDIIKQEYKERKQMIIELEKKKEEKLQIVKIKEGLVDKKVVTNEQDTLQILKEIPI